MYTSDKSTHTEVRHNTMPDWEYDQNVAQLNSETPLSSGEYSKSYTMLSFKLAYSIPTKIKIPFKK